jgi:hypothetical protein
MTEVKVKRPVRFTQFVRRYGYVQYTTAKRRRLLTGICEYADHTDIFVYGCSGHIGLDHCHKHGWVRAEVCMMHNTWMQHLDLRIGYPRDYTKQQVNQARQCPECNAAGWHSVVTSREYFKARYRLCPPGSGHGNGITSEQIIAYALAGRMRQQ